ncbi:MAG: MBL fold hydrolase [Acidobacteria bacterium 21-70-11]|nr:MAG: MBL fold hydrolase [Acidobacteria bacterium 21-70-11]OYW05483.1 MAG: MBL fold hydrolase [Acidobacteria bacterium 37-71-11]HQT94516.1 MBL fold metallo-hydrolase [Thermoanaerobaculaceae bacterium]HQU33094.1 MBL fold metallo-hydrolase [Thermoanaerobaculaceae bacterium]
MDPSAYPIQTLDLDFQGEPGVIAAFLIRSSAGPVLVESGPASTYGALEAALRRAGVEPSEVGHVLLTHIHLDHAGAAWRLASLGAQVHVHPAGAPHLQDPSKLLASARKIYREQMDPLWGALEPIPAERIRPLADGEVLRFGDVAIEALFTPGHAVHHVAFRLDGAVFTGDVGGVRIDGGPAVAPCPPPDIDQELWMASLDRIRAVRPQVLYLTHFGPFTDAPEHLDGVERSLRGISAWVLERMRAGGSEDGLVASVDAYARGYLDGVAAEDGLARSYQLANPAFMSAAGLARYWRKAHPEALASS